MPKALLFVESLSGEFTYACDFSPGLLDSKGRRLGESGTIRDLMSARA